MFERPEFFPDNPEIQQEQEERERAEEALTPSFVREFRKMAREARYLAEMWSEFPPVAECHQSYARAFESLVRFSSPLHTSAALENRCRVQARRLAWKTYRKAVYPRPLSSRRVLDASGMDVAALAAQQQKVDAYWSARLWKLLGASPTRLSILGARECELQQLYDSRTEAPAAPQRLFNQLRLLRWSLRVLSRILRCRSFLLRSLHPGR